MATELLLLRLPEEPVRRFRRSLPSRERSLFVQHLLEQNAQLNGEMDEWASATLDDGLAEGDVPSSRR
jgi:hypothetical protein